MSASYDDTKLGEFIPDPAYEKSRSEAKQRHDLMGAVCIVLVGIVIALLISAFKRGKIQIFMKKFFNLFTLKRTVIFLNISLFLLGLGFYTDNDNRTTGLGVLLMLPAISSLMFLSWTMVRAAASKS